jgi:transposase
MISEECRSRIRRLFFAEHWKVGTIAAELGVHHETVEQAVCIDRFANQCKVVPSALDPYKPFILETLEKHPRLRATRIHAMVESRGYRGSVVQVRRFVRIVRPAGKREAFFRLSTLPGEQAQVDWASFGSIKIGNATRKLSCFVLVLSWSRGTFGRFYYDQTLESFMRGHVQGFSKLGGVPRSILYDNLKTAVLERVGDHIRFHPRLLELAGHYHFAPRPCAPYRGNEKGKVERMIHYLRHSFFAARRFDSLEDLNAQLDEWIDTVAHARPVPGAPDRRPVRDALAEEQTRLLPLPAHPFETEIVRPVASGKTPYIRFDQNDYSIPHELVRKPLTMLASESVVRILDRDREVARHARSYDRAQRIEEREHLAALHEQKRHARELRGRDLLRQECPHADAFIGALALQGSHLGATTTRLLALLDRFGKAALDAAIAEAHGRGAFSAQSIEHILDQSRRAQGIPPPLEVVLPNDPRVRGLRVTPHSLTSYDTLMGRERPGVKTDE